MHSFEVVWWISCSTFKHCAMHSAIRSRKLNPIGLRPIDDDLVFELPQVVAVQFDKVKGVEEYLVVSAVVTDEIERGNAVVIAGDSFAVDNAGARALATGCHRRHLSG